MKPFLKIQLKRKIQRTRHLSVAHDKIEAKNTNAKTRELKRAVEYCKENNCRGYAAIATGMFTHIKDPKAINKRLDSPNEEIIFGQGKPHQRVMY